MTGTKSWAPFIIDTLTEKQENSILSCIYWISFFSWLGIFIPVVDLATFQTESLQLDGIPVSDCKGINTEANWVVMIPMYIYGVRIYVELVMSFCLCCKTKFNYQKLIMINIIFMVIAFIPSMIGRYEVSIYA